jgi:hypothetical protein
MFFEVADGSYLTRSPQAKINIDGQILLPALRQVGVDTTAYGGRGT